MAKDVDLSSKEWRDIVFEGKNKEYGAYTLRAASERRHNRAMIAVVIIIAVVAALGFLVNTVIKNVESRPDDLIEQELAVMATEEVAEEEPEPEQQRVEEQKPEALPEEILNTVKSSEIKITADEEVTEEIKSQDDLKNDDRAVGAVDFNQGTDDLNVVREHKEEVIVEEKKPEPPKKEEIFKAVEQMPTFPGGEAALMQYLSSHIRYPAAAQENGIQGRVVVQFVVTKTGSIGEVKVVRSKDPDLDREAIRVVKTLPKFNPGRMNGQAVSVWYTLPVNFKLQGQ